MNRVVDMKGLHVYTSMKYTALDGQEMEEIRVGYFHMWNHLE
jgi:hypothetical protein